MTTVYQKKWLPIWHSFIKWCTAQATTGGLLKTYTRAKAKTKARPARAKARTKARRAAASGTAKTSHHQALDGGISK